MIMDELASAVQKKYIEDITQKYPIHRFFIMFILLFSFFIYSKENDVRLLSELNNIKLSFIFDFKSGLLAESNFEQLVFSVIATWFIGYSYAKISSKSFNFLAKASKFDDYISQVRDKITSRKSHQEVINYFLAKDVSKELEGLRVKLKSYHTRSEIFLTSALSISWGWSINSYLDWILVILLLAMVAINIWKAFTFYISDFLPYYITEQTLLGAKVEFGDQ
ncbi:hypothetical protein VCSRO12_3540 [Vibrio cholerae]|nr:hypothetical protein VCSRO12_3540 [Vibrio cholerae]